MRKRIELARLVSYVKNAVERDESQGRDRFIFHNVGTVNKVSSGRGILYSWIEGVGEAPPLQNQFVMLQGVAAEYGIEQDQIIVESREIPRFPASGFVSATGEGYVLVPALKLEVNKGTNIVLVVLSPRTSPHQLSVEKNILDIPREDSTVTVSTDGGELRCLGTIAGRSKTARIIINRNPQLPVYRAGFNEPLGTLKGRGRITATWRPVARNFEELALVFYPSRMSQMKPDSLTLDKIAEHLGLFGTTSPGWSSAYVIGDGPGVEYTLRLKMGFGLRRFASVETRLTVS